ncbi:TetR/AcrR family transcriptional regulator (plasmid) [Streptomyces sp. NBC_00080]|uniref:TetR/AcrR family transcriptional regulator n=1 Tax=unclassified Streptomyces TaxID=2593676 RepID=UPI001168B536|nr:TetR/AcrR family transcriptional regulator [Streptomyces sp. SLBN-115]TQJ37882.1 TetR family transcriptional regulator [Streptomyces sp. SLBN-115]
MGNEPRPLRADARRNRDRLLEVARGAFAAEGVSVPLDEIARRAGVGPGTLYRHFPTKESLLEAVVRERVRRLVDHAQALRHDEDPAAALFALLDQVVEDAAAKADLVDTLAGAGVEIRTALATDVTRLHAEIGHLLIRAQDSGAVRGDIGIADLMTVLGGVLYALRHLGAGATREHVVAILYDGLRTGAPA